jgi:hypothetical protein
MHISIARLGRLWYVYFATFVGILAGMNRNPDVDRWFDRPTTRVHQVETPSLVPLKAGGATPR